MEKQCGKLEWPQEAVMELVKLWEKNECLYNPKHKFYHNKHARYAALDEMAASLSVYSPGIGSSDIKNKLQYLRGQYTRELSKGKTRRSGAGADEQYIAGANWPYDLSFLYDFVQVRKGGCNLYCENSMRTDDSLDSSVIEVEMSPVQPTKRARGSSETPQTSRSVEEESALKAAASALKKLAASSEPEGDSRNRKFCDYLLSELEAEENFATRGEMIDKISIIILENRQKVRRQRREGFEEF